MQLNQLHCEYISYNQKRPHDEKEAEEFPTKGEAKAAWPVCLNESLNKTAAHSLFIENFRRLRQKNSTNCQDQMDIQALGTILLKIFAVCVRKIQ